MAWIIDNVRIFVQEANGETGQIIPRLQPLSGGTVLQIFGYDSKVENVSAIVVGDVDRDALMAMPTTGDSYIFSGPEGYKGLYFVKKSMYRRIPNFCQTMRPDLDEDAPVYNFDLELYPDV